MLALTFEPTDSEQEDSENDGDSDYKEQESQEEDEPEPDAPEPQVKKKRANSGPREFKEADRGDHSDSTNEDIIVFISKHLDECNQNGGIQHLPGTHKDSKISILTFNAGEHGRQTKTWSPTRLFFVLCEIDVNVNVRQKLSKPLCRQLSSLQTFTLLQTRLVPRTKASF